MRDYRKHLDDEIKYASLDLNNEYTADMIDGLLELLDVLEKQGHSGYSHYEAMALFNKIANFKPLTALTGDDIEWFDHGDGWFQNKRSGDIFKEGNNQAYWLDGYIFVEPDGASFTSSLSRKYITFPYNASTKPTYIKLPDIDLPSSELIKLIREVDPDYEPVTLISEDFLIFCRTGKYPITGD
jgi:hypothetical protein